MMVPYARTPCYHLLEEYSSVFFPGTRKLSIGNEKVKSCIDVNYLGCL